jgi:CRP-like cAMP-binding protein
MAGTVRKIGAGAWDSPFLMRLRHFVDLTSDDIETLRALIELQTLVEKRRDLVVDGYPYAKLCFVKHGMAARYKVLRNGKRQIVNVLVPGDIVGLPGSFLDHAPFSVIALTDMKLEVCAHEAFVAACYRRPKFALALSWLAVQEATLNAEHIVDIGRRTPVERLARFLLEMHARLSMVGHTTGNAFDLPISQEVISDALGLSVPHLNRTLARLRKDGMVVVADRRIELVDAKALQQLAHFQPLVLQRIPVPLPVGKELIA